MNSLPIHEGVARVTITVLRRHPLDERPVFRAAVSRDTLTPTGHRIPLIEFVAEHFDERVVRRALRLRGYPFSKKAVPVAK